MIGSHYILKSLEDMFACIMALEGGDSKFLYIPLGGSALPEYRPCSSWNGVYG